jgi:hypothetical protein
MAMTFCRLARKMATQRMVTAQSPLRTSQTVRRRRRLLRRLQPRRHAQRRRSPACRPASTPHRWLNRRVLAGAIFSDHCKRDALAALHPGVFLLKN